MNRFPQRAVYRIAAITVVLVLSAFGASADDRNFLRTSASAPNVFVLLDTSGSMNLTPPCSAEDACSDIDPYDQYCTTECELGTACANVCPNWGCVRYDDDIDVLPPIDDQLDQGDPTGVAITGPWSLVPNPNALNGAALVATPSAVDHSVVFSYTVSETRAYKVSIHVPPDDTLEQSVPVTITTPRFTSVVSINQQTDPIPDDLTTYEPWKLVGIYDLLAGEVVTVTIANFSGSPASYVSSAVVADGVRFLSEVKQCVEENYRCEQPLCPDGDCFASLNSDDPTSKFYQAKSALYEVLDLVDSVNVGFGTFEQDKLQIFGKHWLYKVRALQEDPDPSDGIDPPAQTFFTMPEGTVFPQIGAEEVFGLGGFENSGFFGCGIAYPGCSSAVPADLSDETQRLRLGRFGKLGRTKTLSPTTYFVKENAADTDVFRVDWTPTADNYGEDVFHAGISMWRCTDLVSDSACASSRVQVDPTKTIAYDLVSDFIGYDELVPNAGFALSFDSFMRSTCGHPATAFQPEHTGWDPNTDAGPPFNFSNPFFDRHLSYNVKQETVTDARDPGGHLDEGDVIPWDWDDDHIDEVQGRLAPNTITSALSTLPTTPPDFRNALYMADDVAAPDFAGTPFQFLRHKDGTQKPLVAGGATPLGFALDNIRTWYEDFAGLATSIVGMDINGDPIPADTEWDCRQKYVLMVTDGDDTCSFSDHDGDPSTPPLVVGTDPCAVATTLSETYGVSTYVVGFGLEQDKLGTTNRLTCMAENGGTGEPIFPRNKDELVEALVDIFGEIQVQSRTFASASTPAVQSTAADKIYLSSFTPVPDKSIWPGRVDAYRQPLPLTADGEPDVCRSCDAGLESECHLYNVGDIILTQAPTDAQVDSDNYRLGLGTTERRLFYATGDHRPTAPGGIFPQPGTLRLFDLPDFTVPAAEDSDLADLLPVFTEITDPDLVVPATRPYMTVYDYNNSPSNQIEIPEKFRDIFRTTMRIKNEPELIDNSCDPGYNGDYLLGDVFHADPIVTIGPDDARFYAQNLCGEIGAGTANCPIFTTGQEVQAQERGYRNFVQRNSWVRRMLVVGSNDGQLHFFDAGRRRELASPFGTDQVAVYSDGDGIELFSFMPRLAMPVVRAQSQIDDHVYSIDGSFAIRDVVIDPVFPASGPTRSDREWRRVLIGGMREIGDVVDTVNDVQDVVPGYYALDITQPDRLVTDDGEIVPDDGLAGGVLPSCLSFSGDDQVPVCQTLAGEDIPFPALKWEFTDRFYWEDLSDLDNNGEPDYIGRWHELDEDGNLLHDLTNSWSQPLVSQIQVMASGGQTDTSKWVAIFGGGLHPDFKDGGRGNFLYMVDIETGQAIYKREVNGAIASNIAGLDYEQDGYLDVIYVPTTTGLLYKVDLREPVPIETEDIEANQILDWPAGAPAPVEVDRIVDVRWDPYPIFDTEGKAIYHSPATVFIPELDRYALAFGTGDRERLWDFNGIDGRFYFILDEDFERLDLLTPLVEGDYFAFSFNDDLFGYAPDGTPVASPPNFLLDSGLTASGGGSARPGWVMQHLEDARMSSRAFVLSGVVVFTMFSPRLDPELLDNQFCIQTGTSRTFVVDARTGDALTTLENLRDPSLGDNRGLQAGDRFAEREGFGTAPFVSSGASANPGTGGEDALDPLLQRLMENLKNSFHASGCSFSNSFLQMIQMQFDNTGFQDIVPVPVALCPADWSSGVPVWSED